MDASLAGIVLVMSLIVIGLLLFPYFFIIMFAIILLALAGSLWQSNICKIDSLFAIPTTDKFENVENGAI